MNVSATGFNNPNAHSGQPLVSSDEPELKYFSKKASPMKVAKTIVSGNLASLHLDLRSLIEDLTEKHLKLLVKIKSKKARPGATSTNITLNFTNEFTDNTFFSEWL